MGHLASMLVYNPKKAGTEIERLISALDVGAPLRKCFFRTMDNVNSFSAKEINQRFSDECAPIMALVDDMPEYKELCRGMDFELSDHGLVGVFVFGAIQANYFKDGVMEFL